MNHQNLPIRKSEHYNLLLIPEDHRKVRKIRLSIWKIRGLFIFLVLAVIFSSLSFAGYLHYRSLHLAFQTEKKANIEFSRERATILENLKMLESVVDSTEGYANRLAALVGTERPELRKGIGPIKGLKLDVDDYSESPALKELDKKIDELHERAGSMDLRIRELVGIQEEKVLYIASRPSIWPVKGWVTSEFGYRRSPLTQKKDFHGGLDIGAQWGTDVVAPAAGVVRFSGYKGGLGKTIIIDHGYGIRSYYGHAASLLVRNGAVVKRGQKVARVGSSGHSTGPHLHYEIHVDGVPVDPMQYILQ